MNVSYKFILPRHFHEIFQWNSWFLRYVCFDVWFHYDGACNNTKKDECMTLFATYLGDMQLWLKQCCRRGGRRGEADSLLKSKRPTHHTDRHTHWPTDHPPIHPPTIPTDRYKFSKKNSPYNTWKMKKFGSQIWHVAHAYDEYWFQN